MIYVDLKNYNQINQLLSKFATFEPHALAIKAVDITPIDPFSDDDIIDILKSNNIEYFTENLDFKVANSLNEADGDPKTGGEEYKGIFIDRKTGNFKILSGRFPDKKAMIRKYGVLGKGYIVRKVFERSVFDWIVDNAENAIDSYLMFSTAFSKWKDIDILKKYYSKLIDELPQLFKNVRNNDVITQKQTNKTKNPTTQKAKESATEEIKEADDDASSKHDFTINNATYNNNVSYSSADDENAKYTVVKREYYDSMDNVLDTNNTPLKYSDTIDNKYFNESLLSQLCDTFTMIQNISYIKVYWKIPKKSVTVRQKSSRRFELAGAKDTQAKFDVKIYRVEDFDNLQYSVYDESGEKLKSITDNYEYNNYNESKTIDLSDNSKEKQKYFARWYFYHDEEQMTPEVPQYNSTYNKDNLNVVTDPSIIKAAFIGALHNNNFLNGYIKQISNVDRTLTRINEGKNARISQNDMDKDNKEINAQKNKTNKLCESSKKISDFLEQHSLFMDFSNSNKFNGNNKLKSEELKKELFKDDKSYNDFCQKYLVSDYNKLPNNLKGLLLDSFNVYSLKMNDQEKSQVRRIISNDMFNNLYDTVGKINHLYETLNDESGADIVNSINQKIQKNEARIKAIENKNEIIKNKINDVISKLPKKYDKKSILDLLSQEFTKDFSKIADSIEELDKKIKANKSNSKLKDIWIDYNDTNKFDNDAIKYVNDIINDIVKKYNNYLYKIKENPNLDFENTGKEISEILELKNQNPANDEEFIEKYLIDSNLVTKPFSVINKINNGLSLDNLKVNISKGKEVDDAIKSIDKEIQYIENKNNEIDKEFTDFCNKAENNFNQTNVYNFLERLTRFSDKIMNYIIPGYEIKLTNNKDEKESLHKKQINFLRKAETPGYGYKYDTKNLEGYFKNIKDQTEKAIQDMKDLSAEYIEKIYKEKEELLNQKKDIDNKINSFKKDLSDEEKLSILKKDYAEKVKLLDVNDIIRKVDDNFEDIFVDKVLDPITGEEKDKKPKFSMNNANYSGEIREILDNNLIKNVMQKELENIIKSVMKSNNIQNMNYNDIYNIYMLNSNSFIGDEEYNQVNSDDEEEDKKYNKFAKFLKGKNNINYKRSYSELKEAKNIIDILLKQNIDIKDINNQYTIYETALYLVNKLNDVLKVFKMDNVSFNQKMFQKTVLDPDYCSDIYDNMFSLSYGLYNKLFDLDVFKNYITKVMDLTNDKNGEKLWFYYLENINGFKTGIIKKYLQENFGAPDNNGNIIEDPKSWSIKYKDNSNKDSYFTVKNNPESIDNIPNDFIKNYIISNDLLLKDSFDFFISSLNNQIDSYNPAKNSFRNNFIMTNGRVYKKDYNYDSFINQNFDIVLSNDGSDSDKNNLKHQINQSNSISNLANYLMGAMNTNMNKSVIVMDLFKNTRDREESVKQLYEYGYYRGSRVKQNTSGDAMKTAFSNAGLENNEKEKDFKSQNKTTTLYIMREDLQKLCNIYNTNASDNLSYYILEKLIGYNKGQDKYFIKNDKLILSGKNKKYSHFQELTTYVQEHVFGGRKDIDEKTKAEYDPHTEEYWTRMKKAISDGEIRNTKYYNDVITSDTDEKSVVEKWLKDYSPDNNISFISDEEKNKQNIYNILNPLLKIYVKLPKEETKLDVKKQKSKIASVNHIEDNDIPQDQPGTQTMDDIRDKLAKIYGSKRKPYGKKN